MGKDGALIFYFVCVEFRQLSAALIEHFGGVGLRVEVLRDELRKTGLGGGDLVLDERIGRDELIFRRGRV